MQDSDMIMATDSPKEQKQLGREVANSDTKIWDRNKFAIVWMANNLAP